MSARRPIAGMPEHVVNTPCLAEGVEVAFETAESCTIGLFDGPVGTGKTTAIEWAISKLDVPCANVLIPPRAYPLTALRRITRALTGEDHNGSTETLQDLAVDLLSGWGGLLAIDEAATLGTVGMTQLQYLHDESKETFGLLLVGHGTQAAVADNATLDSRIVDRAEFYRLAGDTLAEVLYDLDERLEETTPTVLARIDQRFCRGRLREWSKILRKLDRHHPEATRITGQIADDLLLRLGRHRVHDPMDGER